MATFSPRHHDARVRTSLAARADTLLVHCGRLFPERHPERSIDTVAALRDAGHRVRLVAAGDGPRRAALERRAAGRPVTFVGFVPNRARLATLLASADVSLAPGPRETFGLSALEALASGTPVVVSASSALPEIVVGSGASALLPGSLRRRRRHADGRGRVRAPWRRPRPQFGWPESVARMLETLRAA